MSTGACTPPAPEHDPGGLSWYEVLGVDPSAGPVEVRGAYREQARALHPDSRDPALPPAEADAALRLVNQAWSVLGDPQRRAVYDEWLEDEWVQRDEPGRRGSEGEHFHAGPRFPWWIIALVVLLVIFVFTAYAGGPSAPQ